jgi:hypothetical protein
MPLLLCLYFSKSTVAAQSMAGARAPLLTCRPMNRLLIIFGTILIVAGLIWPWLRRMPLFHLPGDIIIDRPGFKFFFPLTSMLLISAVISLLTWLFRR